VTQTIASLYCHGDPSLITHPYVSPMFGDLRGLPPLLIHYGERELMCDDVQRFAAKIQDIMVQDAAITVEPQEVADERTKANLRPNYIECRGFPDMTHVFQLFGFLEQTKESYRDVAAFLRRSE
jgi:acetyl esterase/lipase